MKKITTSFVSMLAGLMGFGGTPVNGIPQPPPTYRKTKGEGFKRAEARLREHRKKWAHLPDGSVMTRQRRRYAERRAS